MAHYAKYTRGSVGGLTKHYERAKDSEGRYYRFKNQEIDKERTPLNYNLATHGESQLEFIKRRLGEVHCMNRDDVKVMGSWVVTVPQTVPEEHQREFFERTYKFLAERYGEKNVISAYVHMDETTPHMHFAFIPVIYDKKKDREKVSAKEVTNKADLRTFHTDLQNVMNEFVEEHEHSFECDVLNGATENGNLTVQGLKAKDLEEQNEIEMEVLNDVIEQSNEIGAVVQELQIKSDGLSEECNSLSEERESLSKSLSKLTAIESALEKNIAQFADKRDGLTADKSSLLQRFVETAKIKPIFEQFCKNAIERQEREREERTERKSVVGTLKYYEEQIAQARKNSPFTANKDMKSQHRSDDRER